MQTETKQSPTRAIVAAVHLQGVSDVEFASSLTELRARDAAREYSLELRWFAIGALGIGGLSLIGKDLRYALALHVATCLAAWCGLEFVFERARPAVARAGLALATLLLCVSELCTFNLFIDRDLYDPVTQWLVRVREIVILP